jgi:hypothetical protein
MNTVNAKDDEIVNFPVAKRFLSVVTLAAAKAMEAEATEEPATTDRIRKDTTAAVTDAPIIDWTQVSNMKVLRKGLAKQHLRSGLKMRISIALLDAVAEATLADPPRTVLFKEVYTKAGFTDAAQAKSSLGAFTKVIKRDFHVTTEQAQSNRPVTPNWGDQGEAHYSMTPEIARAWLQSAD